MRKAPTLLTLAAFLMAALIALISAGGAVNLIERRSGADVRAALQQEGLDWARVAVDGLQVKLSGTAPTEATRFRALTIAGSVVDATRVIDGLNVRAAAALKAPRFSIEILRNGDGISLIGLIPASSDRAAVVKSVTRAAKGAAVTDLLDTADYPMPEGWQEALEFSLGALAQLPRSKISVAADEVAITAISESADDKRRIEDALARSLPDGLLLAMDISAPRPVITPFTLRFLIEEGVTRFDACSVDTDVNRTRILAAARSAGLSGPATCTLGLGVPSTYWAEAVEAGISAIDEFGGGSVTFSDADVTLVAPDSTPQVTFDRVVGELEARLPEVFSLQAILPEPVKINGSGENAGTPEFVATRSPEGLVQLRGRLTDDRQRRVVDSYARARFGGENVYAAARLDQDLPDGWGLRVLAAIEALAELNNGSAVVQPAFVDIRGDTGNPEANANIARILSEKLGQAENFGISVTYEEKLDPVAQLPTPQECVGSINAILAQSKITFAPGAYQIDASANPTLDRIAERVKECSEVEMEIGGHTDSQGREEMNLNLSQGRAEAVLTALMARRILTSRLTAKGYGETKPIADNATEAGREANRRIEFSLPSPESDVTIPETGQATAANNEPAADGTGKTGEVEHKDE